MISPLTGSISFAATTVLTASGGTPPYTFLVSAGPSRVNATSGLFTGAGSGDTTVQVRDANCRTALVPAVITVGNAPPASEPDDPDYLTSNSTLRLWALYTMDASDAWGINKDCRSLLIGVTDTGIDYNHPELANNMNSGNKGWNFSVNPGDPLESDPKDDNLHGTHVAGIIAAQGNDSITMTGLCWRARMMSLKFLDKNGNGYTSDAISAIDYGRTQGAKILNNSWGGNGFSQSLKDAVDRAAAAGILFVAAAGNDGVNIDSSPEYPASFSSANVITVASSDSNDTISWFSNYGPRTVAVAAPGSLIRSTFPTYMTDEMTARSYPTDYYRLSGTSMATPQVTGLAALLWSFDSTLTVTEVKDRLQTGVVTGSSFTGKVKTNGRSSAAKVMNPGFP